MAGTVYHGIPQSTGLVAALFVLVASMFQRAGDLMNE